MHVLQWYFHCIFHWQTIENKCYQKKKQDYFCWSLLLEYLFHPLLVFSRPWTSPSYSLHSPAPNLMGIENKSQMQQVGNIFWTDQSILATYRAVPHQCHSSTRPIYIDNKRDSTTVQIYIGFTHSAGKDSTTHPENISFGKCCCKEVKVSENYIFC